MERNPTLPPFLLSFPQAFSGNPVSLSFAFVAAPFPDYKRRGQALLGGRDMPHGASVRAAAPGDIRHVPGFDPGYRRYNCEGPLGHSGDKTVGRVSPELVEGRNPTVERMNASPHPALSLFPA